MEKRAGHALPHGGASATPPLPLATDEPRVRVRPALSSAQWEELALALVLVISISLFPRWRPFQHAWVQDLFGLKVIPWHWYVSILFLVLGLLLTLPTWRRSGLGLGRIREHRQAVLWITLLCVGTVAIVYPQLPVRPWSEHPVTMWLLSPLSQQLIFMGYLYGRLEQAFPGQTATGVPLKHALLITAAFFGFSHVPNFVSLPAGYVAFQIFYTSVLALIPGLTRQWTGSIWPVVFIHTSINFIAWATF
jgi:membrane protease YdiL (CAAX protease family)